MKTIVQKYGGTSVGTKERILAVAARIAKQRQMDNQLRLAVVVSAMSGETNRFVELIQNINPNAKDLHYDMAVAAGEQVSVALMAAALESAGVSAEPLLAYQLGIFTDPNHRKARIKSIDPGRIKACWEKGSVPVVAGFQGVTESMALTTLGRGGSDITAVALAVALQADLCEINTDVDGVFSADPRIVPDAKLIERLDYDTTLELAALGGKVLHSRCVEIGAKYQMPIVVQNSFDLENHRRTLIMSFSEDEAIEAPVVSAVTLDKHVTKISCENIPRTSEALSGIFERVAQEKINVDIIVHNQGTHSEQARVGFTVPEADEKKAIQCLNAWMKEEKKWTGANASSTKKLAKVSVVGLGMKSYPGVASLVFSVLTRVGIEILMISTSEIKISVVVPSEKAELAMQLLHEEFIH